MGTNYYLEPQPPCEHCGRPYPKLHIGKSSVGWTFALHVIPEEGINSLEDWKERWSVVGTRIVDEYGEEITPEEMLQCITDRKAPHPPKDWNQLTYTRNHAEPGPNNLIRRLEGTWAYHGPGTYDLVYGEFS